MESDYVLGIDFGTTNSVCAILSGDDPEIIENAEGYRKTPSVVYYTKDEEQNMPLVGQQAENKAKENPDRVIRSIKRHMGEDEVVTVDGEEHYVEEIGADILRKMRTDAAEKLSVDRSELTDAVITTPAYWESDRNQAVIQAAEMAGFESIRTIKEPAAASIAYGRFNPGLDKTVGVYDLGGGTFDFAIVDINISDTGMDAEYNVIAQSGDAQLGGDDWDERIMESIVSTFIDKHGVNPLEQHHSDDNEFEHLIRKERIRENARQAKEDLSNDNQSYVDISIPFLMSLDGESVGVDQRLTEAEFNSMTKELINRTKEPIHTAVTDANMNISDIDDVILVGGSTRMTQVEEIVRSVFGTEPKKRVNQDEAVAAGAAIKANRDEILLLEVTPLSLGIGIAGGKYKRMIERNERLPARETEVFTTESEGATAVRIPIYQGEREIAEENRHLKTLLIQNMTPGRSKSAQIEVTFEVHQNGIINVQAVENTQNKSVEVELEGENKISDEYVHDHIKEAREMEEMDRKRQKIIDAQNDAKEAISEGERLLSQFESVFEGDERETIKKHIANVRQIRKNDQATLSELRKATNELNEWVIEIGDRARKQGERGDVGPTEAPDVEVGDAETVQESTGVRTSSPGQTVTAESQTPGQQTTGETTATTDTESGVEDDASGGDIKSMSFDEVDGGNSTDDEETSTEGFSVDSGGVEEQSPGESAEGVETVDENANTVSENDIQLDNDAPFSEEGGENDSGSVDEDINVVGSDLTGDEETVSSTGGEDIEAETIDESSDESQEEVHAGESVEESNDGMDDIENGDSFDGRVDGSGDEDSDSEGSEIDPEELVDDTDPDESSNTSSGNDESEETEGTDGKQAGLDDLNLNK